MPKGSVIVTGGAGLIGTAVVQLLVQQGRAVAVVEMLQADSRYGHLRGIELAGYWHRDEFLPALMAGRIRRPEAIIHLGACSATTEADADLLMRANFTYTRELATWCLRQGVRFIYASSAATYGGGALGYRDALDHLPQLRPLNKYGFSKHVFDLWAWRSGSFFGPGAITGLKYFNVYGPHEEHKGEMRSMVLKAYEQICATGRVRLFRSERPDYADGEQRRDFLYVRDAAAMTVWFLDHPEAAGIYNLGSGVERSWNDLARAVFSTLQREPRIEYVAMPENLRGSYQYATCADLTRLRGAGCRVRARTIEEGVQDYFHDCGFVPA